MAATFHHVGIVVTQIDAYLPNSVWEIRGDIVTDPIQNARLCMTALPGDAVPQIELIEPLSTASPLWQTSPGPHHVCLSVSTMEQGDALMREKRLLPVTNWQPAILFGGRAIKFGYSRNRELLELLSDEIIG